MDPIHRDAKQKGVQSESLLDKLGKRPMLLIVATALVSFLIASIPSDVIQAPLRMISGAASQMSIADITKGIQLWVSAPSLVLFVVVCLVILLIVSSSHSDAGGQKSGSKADDRKFEAKASTQEIQSKKGSQATTLIESIFSDHLNPHNDHLIPPATDDYRNKDATADAPVAQNVYNEEQDESFTNQQDDDIEEDSFCSSPIQAKRELTNFNLSYKSGDFEKVKRLSRPATSTGLPDRDDFRNVVDAKMADSPHSFKEDASQEEKDDLNDKFDAFLENFRQQLKLQKMESLLRRQKDPESTGEDNPETSLENNVHSLANDLLEEDEDDEELSAEELNERVDQFVSNFRESFTSQQQEAYPSLQQTHPTPKNGSSSSADASKAPSQLTRRDSLAIDNQKFDAFLHYFRNELKMQKQQSMIRMIDR